FGGTIEYRGLSSFRPYAYALVQRDKNERDFATFSSLLDDYPTRFKYDSEYYGVGVRGTVGPSWMYYAEFVKEQGHDLSNSFNINNALFVPQTREKIDSWAVIAGLSYFMRDKGDSRVDFEFVSGSGDSDRLDSSDTFGGNLTGTKDTAFNALGYVNTGLALSPEPSNLLSFQLGYSTSPFAGWCKALADSRVGINGFLFAKIDGQAPLNVPTNTHRFVGGEVDFFFDWRVTSDVYVNLRYGIFLPGDAMPEDQDDARHFVYAGFTYAF
ncbi:MAG TPA: alginate export family protein, partial [Phycisphaerales bacterium]|nr:alginate export family protein [Phycisphaerales bacterium]